MRFYFVCMNLRAGGIDSYCGEDKTLGPRVSHLNLLQCPHYCLHFSGMASLRSTGRKNEAVKMAQSRFQNMIYLDRYVLVLTGWLGSEYVGDLSVWCGLPTNGTLDGPPPRAHTVMLHNDCDALIAEAVAAGQHGPLGEMARWGESHK